MEELAAVFDQIIGPVSLEASMRAGYQSAWRMVLTWSIAHEAVGKLLPISKQTLKGLTQELLMVGCSAGTVNRIWCIIEDRHRQFNHPLLLRGAGDFRRLFKAVALVKGTPSKLFFPTGIHHIRSILELVYLTACQERNILVCVLGVVLVCRVIELAELQICDMLWDHDADYHIIFLGTLAVHISKQDACLY